MAGNYFKKTNGSRGIVMRKSHKLVQSNMKVVHTKEIINCKRFCINSMKVYRLQCCTTNGA